MKQNFRTFTMIGLLGLVLTLGACDKAEELLGCTGCPDSAPYGTKDGDCYATKSECEDNESGDCVICQ